MSRSFDEIEDLAVEVATEVDNSNECSDIFFVDLLDEALDVIEQNPKMKNVKTLARMTWAQMNEVRK